MSAAGLIAALSCDRRGCLCRDSVRRGRGRAHCPAHRPDDNPSLSVNPGRDVPVVVHCHAGCPFAEVLAALRALGLDHELGDGGVRGPHPVRVHVVARLHARPSRPKMPMKPTGPVEGCALAAYADARKLPISFLRELGLADTNYMDAAAVHIPFRDVTGRRTVSVQYRVALDGPDRLRWKRGCSHALYGLDRIGKATDYITIVEGTSDSHTMWWHGEPAIGVPSAATGAQLLGQLADLLARIPLIYAVREPGQGGAALVAGIAGTAVRERLRVVDLAPHKDPSAMHIADPAAFPARWRAALRRADWSGRR